jgi:hypothetical protein
MSDQATAAPKAKKEIVYRPVTMTDGRVVQFAGTRRVDVDITVGDGEVTLRWDFDNGETRALSSRDLQTATALQALGHGLKQKVADSYADAKDSSTDDIVLAVEEMFARLRAGDWFTARQPGDSTAGASVVIRAIIEVQAARGKTMTVQAVKDYLAKRIEDDKARGGKLTRQALYSSFRALSTPTGPVIKRLEEEAAAKKAGTSGVDAAGILDDMA